ncbi:MAG: preprotein translocase subunit SecA, partial [Candidatus Magasanikbacteria bacterium]|nr:preprotein translocase subunit SecA [Candidatus Magasanikbacteria bacterium]
MKLLDKLFGDPNEKIIKEIQPIIDQINSLEPDISQKSDEELRAMTRKFQAELKDLNPEETEKKLNEILPEVFAMVREAGKRVLGMRHFDVQLIGGVILHRGQIAEMKTGEGKTLVATLSVFLNALPGRGAQLITVNDYLSRVGAGWMAPVYSMLGLTTGVIIHDAAFVYDENYISVSQQDDERLKKFRPVNRKEAYACDIIYGTNNEFGFDFLRDSMAPSVERMVQRDLNFVIVDEIDSILIDEARTPLIISAPAEESTDKYYKFAQLVIRLKENEDYNVDEKMRTANLSESGIQKMETWLGVENIYTMGGISEAHHIEQALKAHALFKVDRDYVVKEGEIIIVDEFTGRLMHGRRYSEGLHQAIEAKENVKIQRESDTLATITFQNYFRMYKKLAGMTGTAATEAEEFSKIYNLDTVTIPTNKPNVRKDLNDLIYRTEEAKFNAVIADVKERNAKGQPILIGTISIEKNEVLAGMMERQGLRPQVLNAKNHEKEARFIELAGTEGAITIATNMAGRGVDIILGGPDGKEASEKIRTLGGLHVIGTERHESRRIDNQLRGRAGRQGDPGSSQFYVSMDDDLMRIFGGDRMKKVMSTLNVPDDMPVENKLISRSIESAQTKVEGNNFDIRKHLVDYDDVMNKHRETVYGKRREILKIAQAAMATENNSEEQKVLAGKILEMVNQELEQVVSFHTAAEQISDWNLEEIYQVVGTIFPVEQKLKGDLDEFTKSENHKFDKALARTKIIEHLEKLASEVYDKMSQRVKEVGVNWVELEKSVMIRSIDTLWIEHLEAMASVRQGIGLRGYGQRDPLVEYKKEAYRLYNELNSLIQKEVVYSIYKIGLTVNQNISAPTIADRAKQFSAPAKEATSKTSSFSGVPGGAGEGNASNSGFISFAQPKVKDEEGNKIGRNDLCP